MINERQVRKFCKEDLSKIKNYDLAIADTTQTWDCHHMTETWWNCSKQELIENECYYNRKACELIFLTHAEHARLHMKNMSDERRRKISEANRRRTHSEATKRKISEALKGRTLSDDTCRRMSESHKNMSDETRKKMRDAAKRRWAKKRGEI